MDKSMNGLVSVIMPYWRHNVESLTFLEEALQSLENQVYKDFELILCIDSPRHINEVREVENIVEKFNFKADVIIRKSDLPNISRTRNKALGFAIGRWIVFLDADNIWHKGWLSYMVDRAKKVYPDAVYSRAAPDKTVLYHGENLLKRARGHDTALDIIGKDHFDRYLNEPANPLFGTVMLCQEHLDKIGVFDPELEIYETSLMMVKLFMNFKVHYVKESFLYTRVWSGAISTRGGHQNLVDCKDLFQRKAKEYLNDISNDSMD